ncbi:binding partner of ACD11 1 [Impatiens glandulifera]|uniref:binding partner of ACD11 1 n=1 Tax=Impatiens glandulifera TaxID=253017 RepID=UPI001FB10EE1|nr:binding partner of ACD11 1 [Impatiens glandulifera]
MVDMSPSGYTVEVTGLSNKITEKDIYEFFAFCGTIEHVDIVRAGDYACTTYVTFKESYAMETAVLLSGATIVDQHVCITRWGDYDDSFSFWNQHLQHDEDISNPAESSNAREFTIPSAGEAVSFTQDIVKGMIGKGYVLGKDALTKAKALDESYKVSASATAKVVELSERVGLADTIFAGMEAVKSVDGKFHISDTTRSAVTATGRTVAAAANSVAKSSYFSAGALWMSDALTRAAKVASDLGNNNNNRGGANN